MQCIYNQNIYTIGLVHWSCTCCSVGSTTDFLVQIVGGMKGPAPMLRLLQGDVGSSKTAVAMMALMAAAGSCWQGALMAPTEVPSTALQQPDLGIFLLHVQYQIRCLNGYCV